MSGPLTGVKIVDLTSVILGPYAAQILGDMGAEVIKVESPEGDMIRYVGKARSPGMGGVFLGSNRNKRSICIDLKTPEGKQVIFDLIKEADVFIHSMRPQAIERLGLTYKEICKVNPEIVYAAGFGYGRNGPYDGLPAYDDMIQAASGIASLAMFSGGEPAYAPFAVADKTVGMALAGATLGALYHKAKEGRGQEVEVPMFEQMVAYNLVEHIGGYAFEPPNGPAGYSRVLDPNRRPYRTKDDRFISVLPYSDDQWLKFFQISGRDDLVGDQRFEKLNTRSQNIAELYAIVAEEIEKKKSEEWLRKLLTADIPAVRINTIEDILNDEHLIKVGLIEEVEHPTEGRVRVVNPPVKFSRTPSSIKRLAPRLGEHSAEILRELGYGTGKIEKLVSAGVVRQPD